MYGANPDGPQVTDLIPYGAEMSTDAPHALPSFHRKQVVSIRQPSAGNQILVKGTRLVGWVTVAALTLGPRTGLPVPRLELGLRFRRGPKQNRRGTKRKLAHSHGHIIAPRWPPRAPPSLSPR